MNIAMNASRFHPCSERLTAFALGKLDEPNSAEIEVHLDGCEICGARLDAVPDDAFILMLRAFARQMFADKDNGAAPAGSTLVN